MKFMRTLIAYLLIVSSLSAATITLPNIAALSSARPGDGDVVITLGGNAIGDKGSRTYRYSASSVATVSSPRVLAGPGGVGRYVLITNDNIETVATVNDLFAIVTPADGQLYQTREYTSGGGVGDNIYRYVADPTGLPAIDGGFVLPGIGGTLAFIGTTFSGSSGTGRFVALDQSVADVTKFGALGNGAADDTSAVQRSLNSGQYREVYLPRGTYGISSSLEVKTATRVRGDGWHEQGSVIKMISEPASVPTFTGSTSYTPTLDYSPILYNKSGIQWFSIECIYLDGSNLDVYGLRLQENFYGHVKQVRISNCNQYSYINVRGQAIVHDNCAFYDDSKGVLMFDTTSCAFNQCGFEGLSGAYACEIRSPVSTKSGVTFEACWFEGGALGNPTTAHVGAAGRGCSITSSYFSSSTACNAIKGLGTADALTFDGISNANAIGCQGGRFTGINATGSSVTIAFGSDTKSNYVEGNFGIASITDSGAGNSFRAVAQSSLEFPFVTGRFQVRNLDATVSNAVFDADNTNNSIYMLKNQNNKIILNSGIFEMHSNASMRLRPNGSLSLMAATGQNILVGDSGLASDWQDGHIVLGNRHIWVDAIGDVRIKSGAPTFDTDGTVVGGSGHPIGMLVPADGATSITVTDKNYVQFQNTGATSVTAFATGNAAGHTITVTSTNGNTTIVDSTNVQCEGNTNLVLAANDHAEFIWDGTVWWQCGANVAH